MRHFSFEDLTVRIFGGWGEIGGNQIFLQTADGSLLLDFGKAFGRWGMHFTEFLTPRNKLGLRDLLALNLLPRVKGLYRQTNDDTLFASGADLKLLENGVSDIDGEQVLALLLSHAHLDHSGGLGYLRADLPIVATAATAAIAKAMQDTSRVGVEGEATYLSRRKVSEEGILEGDRRAFQRRKFLLLHGSLPTFQNVSPAQTKPVEGEIWDAANASLQFGNLRVEAFAVDHSIPGAVAFAVETPQGLVVYSGDVRLHGHNAQQTENFLQEIERRKTFLLIMEGTRLGSSSKAYKEAQVKDNLHNLVQQHKGSFISVDFAPRNLERLCSVMAVGKEVGRSLVVTPKDAYLLWGLGYADSHWLDVLQHVLVLKEGKARTEAWEQLILDQAKSVTLNEIVNEPGKYILAFGFYEVNRLLDLRLLEEQHGKSSGEGVYIFSNSYWADDEQILDLKVLLNWLKNLNFRLYPEKLAELPEDASRVDNPYHTSGHAPEEDLATIVQRINPRHLLPVHTEHPQRWLELLKGSQTVVLL
ncbi:MAG: MBL fold metallo-hydrolase [Thermoflexales bacterium]